MTTRSFQPEPFGRYFLIDRMAVGGMAEIFRGTMLKDGGFQRVVVIKRILEHLNDEQQFIDMFLNEARITVTLTHPNIVQIYDFDRLSQHYYIAMEYVQGKDLRALLKAMTQNGKLLPVDLAAYVAHEAARGLHFAHSKTDLNGNRLNIVHRDISPANLLVSYDGNVKVADFGIARAESNLGHTRTGTLKGKFEYMSPEQIDLLDIDGRSDLFALGVVLYNLLTGRRLFKGKNDIETLENVRLANVEPPSKFNPDIPSRMDEIVLKALARDRDHRYASGRDLAEDLAEFMYPVSPDQMREALGATMDEYFTEQKTEEQRSLEEGTRLARAANDSLDENIDLEELDTAAQKLETTDTIVISPSALPWVGGAAVHTLVWLVALLVWIITGDVEVPVMTANVSDPSRFGSVSFDVDPDVPVQLWVNGLNVAEATGAVSYDRLEPASSVQIEVRAEGYRSYMTTIEPIAGHAMNLQLTLVPVEEESHKELEEPSPAVANGIRFESNPTGAYVIVDDLRLPGTTPLSWMTGVPGRAYAIDFEKPGYDRVSMKITFPSSGGVQSQAVTLRGKEGMGKVDISVLNGKAQIRIDGKPIVTQSSITEDLSLRAGTHTITAIFQVGRKEKKHEKVIFVEKDGEQRVVLDKLLAQ